MSGPLALALTGLIVTITSVVVTFNAPRSSKKDPSAGAAQRSIGVTVALVAIGLVIGSFWWAYGNHRSAERRAVRDDRVASCTAVARLHDIYWNDGVRGATYDSCMRNLRGKP